jgi:hypothetical protein
MSDARQAIAAARTAGVNSNSSPELDAANAAISRAEDDLQAGQYTRARLAAMQAKNHAAAALASTHQSADAPVPVPD